MESKKCTASEAVAFIKKDTPIMAFYNYVTVNGTNFDYDFHGRDESSDKTVLHAACAEGNVALAHALISAGTYVNCHALGKRTPLDFAIENGHLNIVKLLVKNGAELIKFSEGDETYIGLAERCGKNMIAKYLSEVVLITSDCSNETKVKLSKEQLLQLAKDMQRSLRTNDMDQIKARLDCYKFNFSLSLSDAIKHKCSLEIIKLFVEIGCSIEENGEKFADMAKKINRIDIADYLNNLKKQRYDKLQQADYQNKAPAFLFLFGLFSDEGSSLYQNIIKDHAREIVAHTMNF